MLSRLKIKTQIVTSVAIILGVIILLQLLLYTILQKENKDVISSFFDSITQNSVQQINKLNNDIAESALLLAVHPTVQANLYEYTASETVKNFRNIKNLLNDYLSSNQNIVFLGIIKNRSLFTSSETIALYDNVRKIFTDFPEPQNSNPVFLPSFVYDNRTYFTCVLPIFPTNISYRTPEHAGNFIVCIYEVGSISFVPSDIIDNSLISLVITDEQNRIMLSSDNSMHGKEFNLIQNKKQILFKTIALSNPAWNVTVYMPSGNTSVFSNLILYFILFMIIFTVCMLFLMLKLLNDIIVKRVILLKENVEKISESDTNYRISYRYNDEFSVIITTINKVLDNVHNLNEEKIKTLDRLYQAELLQKETRVYYLYNQISPHFLYNSLTQIQGLAIQYNAPKILNLVSSFSKIFRYLSNNQTLSNIKKDLDCAIQYFNVINTRRANQITLINTVDSTLYDIPCLKMIYQPILENTLKHAFEIDNSGTVIISSIPDETKAIIEIKDDGCGILSEKLENIELQMLEKDLNKIQNSEQIGLLNVNMRLKLFYNNDCGIKIISEQNKGTTVRITFEKEIPRTDAII